MNLPSLKFVVWIKIAMIMMIMMMMVVASALVLVVVVAVRRRRRRMFQMCKASKQLFETREKILRSQRWL